MKTNIYKLICLIGIVVILSCNHMNAICGTNENELNNKIKESAIQEFSKYEFIIKFSNLIYEKDGKEMKIPIFQGNMGDVSYKDFRKYCIEKKYLGPNVAETDFIIKTEKGKLTKTFRDFLNFYKGNILKDVDISKPAKIKVDGSALDIFYDFEVNGVPFVLHLNISTGEKNIDSSLIKSILDVNLNENMETSIFRYRFRKDYTSKEL